EGVRRKRSMTETEWLTCANLHTHEHELFVSRKASDRKLRLFACGCVRRVQHLFVDPRSSAVLEAAERYAEGLLDKTALKEARCQAGFVYKVNPKGAEIDKQAARAAARAAEIAAMQDKR